jgi:polyferredoxin
VQVCPTGIDIRKGLQYECIGCAACIDVCNDVMDKMSYPRGLIRYDTQNGLSQHLSRMQVIRRMFRPRVLIYSAVLLLVCCALVVSLATRAPVRMDVVRDRASLARIVDDGLIENVYRVQLMNATEQTQQLQLQARGLPGLHLASSVSATLAPAEARWVTVALRLPPEAAAAAGPGAQHIEFVLNGTGSVPLAEKSTFVIPR